MMNFEEFKMSIIMQIKNYLPKRYKNAEILISQVTKNNDVKLTGIVIQTAENSVTPNIYLESLYKQYADGMSLPEILREIAAARERYDNQTPVIDVDKLTNFDQVRGRITCRLVNAEMNEEYLSDKPHTPVEDLAVVYAVDLGTNETGHMSMPVTTELMERYGTTTRELHDVALSNLAGQGLTFRSMRDVLEELMFPHGVTADDQAASMLPPEDAVPPVYVLSNADRLNGAAAILDKATMESISLKLGGDFIVIPSSIHETLILSPDDNMSLKMIEDMIRDVNDNQVLPEERLSYHAYQYDSLNHRLVRMDKLEERCAAAVSV